MVHANMHPRAGNSLVFAVLAFVLLVFSARCHAEDWALTLKRIEVAGTPAPSARIKVTLRSATASSQQDVRSGTRFASGTTLEAPPRTTLQFESSNGNGIRLMPGARLTVTSGSGQGEEYSQDAGQSRFSVKSALNFFNVSHRNFQALVRGTEYTVTVVPAQEITFQVDEGTVEVRREGRIRIDEDDTVGAMTEVDFVAAGQQQHYRLDINTYFRSFGTFKDAERYYRDNLAQDRASGDPRRIGKGLLQLGIALVALSKYREAIPIYQEALDIARRQHPSGGNDDIALLTNNIGIAWSDLGGTTNTATAIDFYGRALAMFEQLHPEGPNKNIGNVLNNLGTAYVDLNGPVNKRKAIDYFNRALSIREQLQPDGIGNDIAGTLNNRGIAYVELGDADDIRNGIEDYSRALRIREQLYPDGIHEDIAGTLNNLGAAHRVLGDGSSVPWYERALAIRRQLYPDEMHSGIASALNNLGVAYVDLGGRDNVRKGAEYLEQSLRIQRQVAPSSILDTIGNLSYVYVLAGDYPAAIKAADEAIALEPNQQWVFANKTLALSLAGRQTEAEALCAGFLKRQPLPGDSFREAILESIQALRAAGIDTQGLKRIEAMFATQPSGPDAVKP